MRIALTLLFTALFALVSETSHAQVAPDTLLLRTDTVAQSHKNVLALDTMTVHSPKKAIFRSAVLPGWGQAYNKKYWKIPIIYAALGTTTYVFFSNINTYNELRLAAIHMAEGKLDLVPEEYRRFRISDIQYYRNAFRQYIDYSVLVFLVFWGLNVVDAAVDAHLKAFDVSPNLSLHLQPAKGQPYGTTGISLVLRLK